MGISPVNGVQRPEDLLPGFAAQRSKCEALLRLMQAKTLRQADSQALIFQQPRIISLQEAEDLGKDKALQGCDVIVHKEALNGTLPLGLEGVDVLAVAWLLDVSQGYFVGYEWLLTSLDNAAMPKTKLS